VTAGGALASAASYLGTRLDAELLLAHVLDVPRAAVVARDDRVLTPEEQGGFEQLLARRVAGEPLAYLTGTREFWSLELEVSRHVLVPRPETELLVEWGLEIPAPFEKGGRAEGSGGVAFAPFFKGGRREAAGGFHVLDIGTGSGAIALALGKEQPSWKITATDISPAALKVAHGNAQRLGITTIEFLRSDLFKELDSRFRGKDVAAKFDLIVSNPPYVAEGDPHLAELKFEPAIALTSGTDGLDALRVIVAGAPEHLRAGGWLLVEHGAQQGEAVRALFRAAGFAGIETRRDLAGLERATGGRIA